MLVKTKLLAAAALLLTLAGACSVPNSHYIIQSLRIFLSLTCDHVIFGFSLEVLCQLVNSLQVFHDVDVGSEIDHVLLPAAIGHAH